MGAVEIIVIILLSLCVLFLSLLIILHFRNTNKNDIIKDELDKFKTDNYNDINSIVSNLGNLLKSNNEISTRMQNEKIDFLVSTLNTNFKNLSESVNNSTIQNETRIENIKKSLETAVLNLQNENSNKYDEIKKLVSDRLKEFQELVANSFSNSNLQIEQKLENIRITVEKAIGKLQDENSKKLDEMRNVVDEKLQKTLEDRLSKSFNIVSERLEQVYKGLGEMQNLAEGVGDLKRVLSNVKTRGILGEMQLESILEQILSPDQYEKNIITKEGSKDPVEFAIKLPGDNDRPVYLPIDAKFPLSDYQDLAEALENGNIELVKSSREKLKKTIKLFAKTIHEKYIDVPNTTEFGIMFLPIEGLYAEVVNSGIVEVVQREYKINIAGPTTMAALLNSLQMGFRTLAIQKRSNDAWRVLGAVKTEFSNFGNILEGAQKKILQANKDLDSLIGTRTRQIQRKLSSVTDLPELEAKVLLEIKED